MRKPRIAVVELLVLLCFGYVLLHLGHTVWSVLKIDVVYFLQSVRGIVEREPYPSPNRWWGLLAQVMIFICVIMPYRMFLQYLGKMQSRSK